MCTKHEEAQFIVHRKYLDTRHYACLRLDHNASSALNQNALRHDDFTTKRSAQVIFLQEIVFLRILPKMFGEKA